MATRGRSARNKGLNFERFIALKFKSVGFPDAKRHLESQIEEALGYDLDNTGPFVVQCKAWKEYASISKINEIKITNKIPLLITKGDNKPAMVVMPLEDFLKGLEDFGYFRE